MKVSTADGSAVAGSDYTGVPLTTLTWSSTDPLTKTVPVTVAGDTLHEGNEAFSLKVSNPVNVTLGDTSGQATIVDEEGPFFISARDESVTEGNDGTKTMTFTVSLSAAPAAGQVVTVTVATSTAVSPTATAGSDYDPVPPTVLTFAAGETSKTVAVTIRGDTTVEGHEHLILELSKNSSNAVIADAQGRGNIVNDD